MQCNNINNKNVPKTIININNCLYQFKKLFWHPIFISSVICLVICIVLVITNEKLGHVVLAAVFTAFLTAYSLHVFTIYRNAIKSTKICENELWAIYEDLLRMLGALERIQYGIDHMLQEKKCVKINVYYKPYSSNILNSLDKIRRHPSLFKEADIKLLFIDNVAVLQGIWRETNTLTSGYNELLNIRNLDLKDKELFNQAICRSLEEIKMHLTHYLPSFKKLISGYTKSVNSHLPNVKLPNDLPKMLDEMELFKHLSVEENPTMT